MKARSRLVFGALLSTLASGSGCASFPFEGESTPATGRPPLSRSAPPVDCPYLNVFVEYEHTEPDKDRFFPGWRQAEPHRQEFLEVFVRALPSARFRVVDDVSDAAFLLSAVGGVATGSRRHVFLKLSLVPTPRLQHHVFIAALNDEGFPFSLDISSGRSVSLYGDLDTAYDDAFMQDQASQFVEYAQAQAFPTVAALCEIRAELIEEGLTLESLREELMTEIQRVRREQRENRAKELDLRVDPARVPQPR